MKNRCRRRTSLSQRQQSGELSMPRLTNSRPMDMRVPASIELRPTRPRTNNSSTDTSAESRNSTRQYSSR
ncbi:hypothetical protein ACFFX0_29765 [Citricoccus parietis]|uniref:Uncharacterized protein n=1 Tax=Citricoccus parietis TaxID=592307 RepID=A0ABV5G926_9MICC